MTPFVVLCITLCGSCFLLALVIGTLVAGGLTVTVRGLSKARSSAVALFAIQVFPVCFAILVTLGWVVPSFLVLEPRSTAETPGLYLWLLSSVGAALVFVFAWHCGRLLYNSNRVCKQWLRSATQVATNVSVPTYRIEGEAPLLVVLGPFRPRIFVSQGAISLLTEPELTAALEHEVAHVHAWDNLKRLVLRAVRLPRWISPVAALESAWATAAECAADAKAVTAGASPLELASALVKFGRLPLPSERQQLMIACHLVAEPSSCLSLRVEFLRQLLVSGPLPAKPVNSSMPALVALMSAVAYGLVIHSALPAVHRIVELLVQ